MTKHGASEGRGSDPHLGYARDTDAEGQFSEAMPWFSRVRHLLSGIPPTLTVLDVGCNSGGLGRRLTTEVGCYLVGADLAFHLLPEARRKGYVAVVQADAAALPFRDATFPVVVLSEILEHVPDPAACVEEAARVLMPRGWLLGDVPHPLGKWGWRSIRGHKWHVSCLGRRKLRQLFGRWFIEPEFRLLYAQLSAGYVLPQWTGFKCLKKR